MKITSLEKQKGNKNRFNLYLDGEFCRGLEASSAVTLGLYEGKEVTETEILAIDNEDSYQKCMINALDLVTRRLQSERELWQKLGKKHEKPIIGRCLNRLRELGYANDFVFAEMWVKERSRTRGPKLLVSELTIKGIDKSTIETVLGQVKQETELDSAKGLALKKFKPTASKQDNYTKVISFLTRRGFSYAISRQVLDEIITTSG